jgi:hypothetical protein
VQPYRAKGPPAALADRLAEPHWLEEALRAIEHLPRCRYFETPATFFQLVGSGFVQRVLAGQYDERKPAKGRGANQGTDERRSAGEAAAEWKRQAYDPEKAAARAEYEAAKAAKQVKAPDPPKGLPDPGVQADFDLELDRVAMIAQLRKGVA